MSQQQQKLAPEADAELQKYREVQAEVERLRTQEQRLLEQNNENSMLKEELDRLDSSAKIYKKIGPVLMRHDLNEGKETVAKRLEHIKGAIESIEKQCDTKAKEGDAIAEKIQKIQGDMQQKAAAEAKAIAQQQGQEQTV